MKKILLILAVGISGILSSCDDKDEYELSDKAQKNLEAQHGVIKCFDTRDFSKLGDYVAKDFVDYAGQNGVIRGLENAKKEFEEMVKMMTDAKSEILVELANDDYVMSWIRFTGKMAVDGMGKKAGESYDMKSIELSKFREGKAIEHWVFMEPAEMMQMMGNMQQPVSEGIQSQ